MGGRRTQRCCLGERWALHPGTTAPLDPRDGQGSLCLKMPCWKTASSPASVLLPYLLLQCTWRRGERLAYSVTALVSANPSSLAAGNTDQLLS